MLEICYGSAVEGSLKVAGLRNTANLNFDLSLGDISMPITEGDCPQRQLFFQVLTDEGRCGPEKAEKIWQKSLSVLRKLNLPAGEGKPMRIWVDETPMAACGLLFTANLLWDSTAPLMVVRCPKTEIRPDRVVIEYRGWGEMAPRRLPGFAQTAVPLDRAERQALAHRWQTLMAENSPLRAVERGEVVSVSTDYYDDRLRREFPQTTCTVAELIGSAIGKQNICTGDWFLAQRVRAFLSTGELNMVEENKGRFYSSVISR